MVGKIHLYKDDFSEKERVIFESEKLSVTGFRYSTGVEAVTLKNDKGYVTLLPFMGQMVWDMEFLGHNVVMDSIFDKPEICYENYTESYGCFLMHCGLTAMGNPTAEDTHLPHGELPMSRYSEAYILTGEDEKGRYIALSGVTTRKRPYEINYEFSPECRLYEGKSTIDVTVNITNKKDLPLEYFYLCHINYKPIDGSKLYYTAKHENITVHHEVPDGYPKLEGKLTNEYLDRLDKDVSLMDTVDKNTQSYDPEIVFTCRYEAGEDGAAHTIQQLPDGFSCYVKHFPDELPFAMRWISRTGDEEAMGMVLPATAEHMGYIYCKSKGQERYLKTGEKATFHMTTGILSPDDSEKMKDKIIKIMK